MVQRRVARSEQKWASSWEVLLGHLWEKLSDLLLVRCWACQLAVWSEWHWELWLVLLWVALLARYSDQLSELRSD